DAHAECRTEQAEEVTHRPSKNYNTEGCVSRADTREKCHERKRQRSDKPQRRKAHAVATAQLDRSAEDPAWRISRGQRVYQGEKGGDRERHDKVPGDRYDQNPEMRIADARNESLQQDRREMEIERNSKGDPCAMHGRVQPKREGENADLSASD